MMKLVNKNHQKTKKMTSTRNKKNLSTKKQNFFCQSKNKRYSPKNQTQISTKKQNVSDLDSLIHTTSAHEPTAPTFQPARLPDD